MTRLWPEEAARSVLGAILQAASYSADAGHRIYRRVQSAGLDPEHFCLESYGELYRVMGRMVDAGIPIDAVSVAAELDREHTDVRVVQRLNVLAHEVTSFETCERHAQIVIDAAVRREIEERAS